MSFQRVTPDNFATSMLSFIQKNNMIVDEYDDIQNVYLAMLRSRYIFTFDRELLHDMLTDLVYYLKPGSDINRDRVIESISDIDEDDGEDIDSIRLPQ